MKMRYLSVPLIITVLALGACEDKEIPVKTSEDESTEQDQSTDLENIDDEIKKYRDKAEQFLSTDISEVIKHQNQAMKAVKKARNMDIGKEQYNVFVNEAIPEAKQAVKEAKSLKTEGNPQVLDQLQEKFVTPLDTFVNLLETKADTLVATNQEKKEQLRQAYEKYAGNYINELTSFYDQLQSVAAKYRLDLNWEDVKALKEQIEEQLDIAEFLHLANDQLQEFISFHEKAIDDLRDVIENNESGPDHEDVQKITEDLFPELDHLFQGDWDEQLDQKQLNTSIDQLKEGIHDQLEALREHKQGLEQDEQERLEHARKKYEQSKQEMEKLHEHLQDVKSELKEQQ